MEGIEKTVGRGYAFHHEAQPEGVKPVGGPVTGPDGRVVSAFSMASPTNRTRGDLVEEQLPETRLETAYRIELETSSK